MYVHEQNLFDAAERGNLTQVVAALSEGVDVNWKNEDQVFVAEHC